MSNKQKKPQHMDDRAPDKAPKEGAPAEEVPEAPEAAAPEALQEDAPPEQPAPPAEDAGAAKLAAAEEKFLRLAAEYDNYRKRTAKEKENSWTEAKAQTVAAFLPVYDNLERAMKQECSDAAYAKGVEMTIKGFRDVLSGLGVETIPALGETFDPKVHNAVMHVDDEDAGENTVVEVFQQGFTCGEKVIRFAMVKVAN